MPTVDPFDEWVPFFEYLVGASAALLGLAFVTFQVRAEHWRGRPLRQPVAVGTLAELAAPLFFGLLFLLVGHPWRQAGYIVGAFGYSTIIFHLLAYYKHRIEALSWDRKQLLGVSVTAITFSILMWSPSIYWKAYVSVWFVFSGFGEAWLLVQPPKGEISGT